MPAAARPAVASRGRRRPSGCTRGRCTISSGSPPRARICAACCCAARVRDAAALGLDPAQVRARRRRRGGAGGRGRAGRRPAVRRQPRPPAGRGRPLAGAHPRGARGQGTGRGGDRGGAARSGGGAMADPRARRRHRLCPPPAARAVAPGGDAGRAPGQGPGGARPRRLRLPASRAWWWRPRTPRRSSWRPSRPLTTAAARDGGSPRAGRSASRCDEPDAPAEAAREARERRVDQARRRQRRGAWPRPAATGADLTRTSSAAPQPGRQPAGEAVGGDLPARPRWRARGPASRQGSQTAARAARSSASVSASASRGSSDCSARPNCCMARIAMRCAARSSKPSAGCSARTASANGPPPGTTTRGGPGPASRARASRGRRAGASCRLPPSLTTHIAASQNGRLTAGQAAHAAPARQAPRGAARPG